MTIRTILSILMVCTLCACSTDDAPLEEEMPERAKSFSVVGEDANSVYVMAYDAENDQQNYLNLTQETGITPNYLTLRQYEDNLSFYTFGSGSFSLTLKNLTTGAIESHNNFYTNVAERSVAWGINTLTDVYFGYFTPDTRDLALVKVPLDGTETTDVTIDFDVDVTYQPLFFEDKIYISYRDNEGNYKIAYYDTLTETVSPILNFENIPISFLLDSQGRLAVIKNVDNATLERYDSDTFTFIDAISLDFATGFPPGPMNGAILTDEALFFAQNYVQPSKYPYGPAVFNFNVQETTSIDFTTIADMLESELKTQIVLTTQVYDAKQGVFLVAYAQFADEIMGGVMQISKEGELLTNVTLPFWPSSILVN